MRRVSKYFHNPVTWSNFLFPPPHRAPLPRCVARAEPPTSSPSCRWSPTPTSSCTWPSWTTCPPWSTPTPNGNNVITVATTESFVWFILWDSLWDWGQRCLTPPQQCHVVYHFYKLNHFSRRFYPKQHAGNLYTGDYSAGWGVEPRAWVSSRSARSRTT